MTKQSILPAVYIVANRKLGAIYTGVTSDLVKRVFQHQQGEIEGFTERYGCKKWSILKYIKQWNRPFCVKSSLKVGLENKRFL